MPFIGAAIGAVVTAVQSAGSLFAGLSALAPLAKAAIGIGLNLLANALLAKKPERETGLQSEVQVGGDVPRTVFFGEVSSAGHLVYWNTYGDANEYLHLVYALSDSHCNALTGIIVNGEEPTLDSITVEDGEDARYVVNGYATADEATDPYYFVVRWYNGGAGQVADQELIDTANPAGRWTSNDKLTGIAYVSVRLRWQNEHFGQIGIPDMRWQVEGTRLYDWRKDSTNGGSGSHRWGTPSTYEYSANPAVILYNVLRGIETGGERVYGLRATVDQIDHDLFTAAANVCDESVSLDAGGTEPRYRCSFIAQDSDDITPLIEAVTGAMAGFIVERGGKIGVIAGASQSSVDTITDDDLVIGSRMQFSAKRPRPELANRVHGTFLDPDNLWTLQSYPPIENSTYETEDGEILGRELPLNGVTSVTQAQRIAKIRLLELRQQATATITLGFNKIWYDAGDWIVWNSARHGNRTWRIVNRQINAADRTVTLSLDEIASSVYSWTAATDEGTPPDTGTAAQPGTLITDVSNFSPSIGGIDNPTLVLEYDAITDPTVDAVVFELRRQDDPTKTTRLVDFTPDNGLYVWAGADPRAKYEARAKLAVTPVRDVNWTSWTDVTPTLNRDFENYVYNGDLHTGTLATFTGEQDVPGWYLSSSLTHAHVEEIGASPGAPAGAPAQYQYAFAFGPNAGAPATQALEMWTFFDPNETGAAGRGIPVRAGEELRLGYWHSDDGGTAGVVQFRVFVLEPDGTVTEQSYRKDDGTIAAGNFSYPNPASGWAFRSCSWVIEEDGEAFLRLSTQSTWGWEAWYTGISLLRESAQERIRVNSITYPFSASVAAGADDKTGTGIGASHIDALTASVTTTIPNGRVATITCKCNVALSYSATGAYEMYLEHDGDTGWAAGQTDVEQPPTYIAQFEVVGTGEEVTYDVNLKFRAANTVTLTQRRLDCELLIG